MSQSTSSQEFTRVLREWTEVFMRRSMHDFLRFTRNAGLSMPQFSTLLHLYHGGSCGVSDVGNHLGVSSAAASQMIDRLVQAGLLERSEDPVDRRAKNLTLSLPGRKLVEESIEARRRWMESLTEALSPQQQEAIIASLNLLTAAALQLDQQTSGG